MYAPLAQLVEQLTLNQWVQGSSPWRCTIYSSIAQSVERMTVNHDVTGSSPVRGATRGWIFQPLFCFPPKFLTSDICLIVIVRFANWLWKGYRAESIRRLFRFSTDGYVFPRLNAQYRHKGGMHESLVRAQFGEPEKKALARASAFFNEICPSGKWNSSAVKYLLRKC